MDSILEHKKLYHFKSKTFKKNIFPIDWDTLLIRQ